MYLSFNFRWPLLPPPLPPEDIQSSAFRTPPAPTSHPPPRSLAPIKDVAAQSSVIRPTAHRAIDPQPLRPPPAPASGRGPPMLPGPLFPPPGPLFMHESMAAKAALLGLPPSLAGLHPSTGAHKKLFGCPQCRYVTDRKNNLKRHVATMHQDCDKVLECCGVAFKNKAALRDHVMLFHSNGYLCRFCGRNFCRKALLKRHLAVHSGQKDFLCGHCDYATSHKSNLERHKRVHERPEGEDIEDDEDEDGPRPPRSFRPFDLINLHPNLIPVTRAHGNSGPERTVLKTDDVKEGDSSSDSDLDIDVQGHGETHVDVVSLVS